MAMAVAGAMTLRLTPLSMRVSKDLLDKLSASQVSADIQPRVFDEDFPNTILYVGDVRPGPVVVWRNVFLADLTPPEQRSSGMRDKAEGPLITVAREAIAIPDPEHNRIQLSMRDAGNHEMGKDMVGYDSFFPRGDQALYAAPPSRWRSKPFSEMNTRELRRYSATGRGVGGSPHRAAYPAGACRSPAWCWRWWAFRWAYPRAKAASRAATSPRFSWRSSVTGWRSSRWCAWRASGACRWKWRFGCRTPYSRLPGLILWRAWRRPAAAILWAP